MSLCCEDVSCREAIFSAVFMSVDGSYAVCHSFLVLVEPFAYKASLFAHTAHEGTPEDFVLLLLRVHNGLVVPTSTTRTMEARDLKRKR